jgi:hypothetical protein
VGRSWRAKFAGAVRPSTVVVPNVLREHRTQVSLTEDQYAVGEFGSERTVRRNSSPAVVAFVVAFARDQ